MSMRIGQSALLRSPGSMTAASAILLAAGAEREHRPEPDRDGSPDGEDRVDEDVTLRELRLIGQPVLRGRSHQQEERVEAAERTVLVGAVEVSVRYALLLELFDARLRLGLQLVAEAELDRLGGTRFRARRSQPVVQPIVAERALGGGAGVVVEADDAEGARRDAVAAAVADVLVDVDRAVLGPIDRTGGTGLEAAGLCAVLAHVGHHVPAHAHLVVAGFFDEANQAIALVGEVGVVLVRPRPFRLLGLELIPLLARHLARPASDAERDVGEHRHGARHVYPSAFRTLQSSAFDSWMKVVGSPRLAMRSVVISPRAAAVTPAQPQCQGMPT